MGDSIMWRFFHLVFGWHYVRFQYHSRIRVARVVAFRDDGAYFKVSGEMCRLDRQGRVRDACRGGDRAWYIRWVERLTFGSNKKDSETIFCSDCLISTNNCTIHEETSQLKRGTCHSCGNESVNFFAEWVPHEEEENDDE